MQRKIGISIGVLAVILALFQGIAVQKQTTIPGIFFPSPTPTRTHTPTVTYTPTITNTPTVTLTPTPDPIAECADKFRAYYGLQHDYQQLTTGIQNEISKIIADSSVLNRAQQNAIEELITRYQTWTEAYPSRIPTGIAACSENIPYLVLTQLQQFTAHSLSLESLKSNNLNDAMIYTMQEIQLTSSSMPYATKLGQELTAYKKKYPQYQWP